MNSSQKKPLSSTQLKSVALLFSALSDPLRLAILQTLCDVPRCVADIVEIVGTSQANVSKHLAKLVSRGVLTQNPNGRNVFYQLANGLPLRLCELVHSEISSLPQDQPRVPAESHRSKKRQNSPASLARRKPKP